MINLQLINLDTPDRPISIGDDAVSIGRHPDNVLVLADDRASRFHCVIEPCDPAPMLRDLGSRNGTTLNNEPVRAAALAPGDVIRIGSVALRIEECHEPAPKRTTRANGPAKRPGKLRLKTDAGGDLPPWAEVLGETIDALPAPTGESSGLVTLIDAGGKPSDALVGDSDGAHALRMLLRIASRARATDLHIEPRPDLASVRMRVDGEMVNVVELPNGVYELIMGLARTACQLKVASIREVLDGHFSIMFGAHRVDYRASFTPSVHGLKLVLRVLDARLAPKSLDQLGLTPHMHEVIKRICTQDAGMLMVCGPTGSGKTTTLHNAMREIDRERRNVVTIEDPVEYHVEGVTQIPVSSHQGNTFDSLLRSVLRQDPDVIMVGEIRDAETARTAMQAAMTGHVVLTTVHAKDTIGSVFRILNLGVEPYLVANSLNIVLAQRLVRVLCDRCKRETPVSPGQVTRMGRFADGIRVAYGPVGCTRCLRTGFRGRRSIYEMLDFTDDLRDVILEKPTILAMKRVIEQGVFTTLQQSGWQLVARGVTSVDEVERVVGAG